MSGGSDAGTHDERIRRAFTAQAQAFEDRRFNRVFTTDSAWLFDRLARRPGDLVLDVAAGTGHAARQLAGDVRAVVAVDATEEMLRRGREAALADGHSNIVFMRADAARLPFLDASFDIVVCRFAVHHFTRPEEQVAEMRRCLRPGGRLLVADLVADSNPAVADVQNELERLRDASHARLLAAEELGALVAGGGSGAPSVELRTLRRPLRPWLEQAQAVPEVEAEIRRRLHSELDGGPVTGFAPQLVGGELWFAQTFASCLSQPL